MLTYIDSIQNQFLS